MTFRILLIASIFQITAFAQSVLDVPKERIYPSSSTQTEPISTFNPLNDQLIFTSAVTLNVSAGFKSEGIYISQNGGDSWVGSDTCTGSSLINHGGDPGVAITNNGRLILTHIGFQFPGMYSNYSDDMGETWSSSKIITTNQSEDKGTLTIDHSAQSNFHGRLYLMWVDFVNLFTVQFSYSDDGAGNWSTPVQVNPNPPTRSTGTSIAIADDGTVYVCWAGVTSSSPFYEDYIGFAKSTNGGAIWTVNQNILDMNGIAGTLSAKSNIKVNSIPQIGIDNSGGSRNGWLYIVTTEKNNPPAGSDPDIIMHRSTDGGSTWSAGIRVNQDPVNDGKIQYFPYLDVDESGDLNILFYDDRNTTSDSASVFITRSTDGGNSWHEYEIKNTTFKPKPIAGGSSGYQGDHISLISRNNQLNAFWMADYTGIYQVWSSVIDKNILETKGEKLNELNSFRLYQNYPNPFNPTTTINYSLKKSGNVSIKLYDIQGREISTLVDEFQNSGNHEIKVSDILSSGKVLSSGVYFYRLTTSDFSQTKSMILLK